MLKAKIIVRGQDDTFDIDYNGGIDELAQTLLNTEFWQIHASKADILVRNSEIQMVIIERGETKSGK